MYDNPVISILQYWLNEAKKHLAEGNIEGVVDAHKELDDKIDIMRKGGVFDEEEEPDEQE